MAVPRSSAASPAANAGKAPHSSASTMARNPGARLMPQLTPRQHMYSRKKAPHIAVKRLLFVLSFVSERRSGPCWLRPPSGHPACGWRRHVRDRVQDRRRRPRTCRGGFRSGRCRWLRPAIPNLRRSAAAQLRAWRGHRERRGAAAATGCGIEPVTSFAAAGAAATAGAAACAARSLSTVSLSLASFAAGSACAFSTLSRRSPALLSWPVVVLELCSRPAFSATISASSLATEASSALSFAEAWVMPAASGHQLSDASGCQRATQRTRHRRQRHHSGHRSESCACRAIPGRRILGVGADAFARRHDRHIAGEARHFRLYGIDLGRLSRRRLDLRRLHLDGIHLGSVCLGSVTLGRVGLRRGLFLLGREFRRLDLGCGHYRFIRRRHVRRGRPGAEGSGFTAGGLGLLIAHVRILPNWLTIW